MKTRHMRGWALMTEHNEVAVNSGLFLVFSSRKIAKDRLLLVTSPIKLKVGAINLVGICPPVKAKTKSRS